MRATNKNLDPQTTILVVDDETSSLDSFEVTLQSFGLGKIILCTNGREAIDVLKQTVVDVVLLDLVMPGLSGEEILGWATDELPQIPIIVVTGIDTVDSAVSCIKAGAFDYLVKPIEENHLRASLGRAIELSALRRENTSLKKCLLRGKLEHPEAFKDFITNDQKLLKVFRYLEAIAPSGQPILITGETGVGKELIARAIHRLTNPKAPFAAVNLAGLDEHLVSDTLFGHRKGAFTSAASGRRGLIENASNGILFLDEIGDLSPASQVKLLRMLEEREYFPLGSDVAKPVEARIIAATHRDLEEMKNQGAFREDLYYRLCTHHVHIPPLRERPGDLLPLARHFLSEAAVRMGKEEPVCSERLGALIASYQYPGNARELRALIFDGVSESSDGQFPLESLRRKIASGKPPETFRPDSWDRQAADLRLPEVLPTIEEMCTILVEEAMRRAGGKQVMAARMLGISQPALSKRLKKISG